MMETDLNSYENKNLLDKSKGLTICVAGFRGSSYWRSEPGES